MTNLTEKKQNLVASLENVQKEKMRIEAAHENIISAEQQVIGAIKLIDEMLAEEEAGQREDSANLEEKE